MKPELYPFTKYKVSKLHKKTAKRAICKEDIMNIINYSVDNKYPSAQQFAIDMFTFSYFMGGINLVDMARLSNSNVIDNHLFILQSS